MIEKMYIRKFRQFKDITLEFNPHINVFMGKNATGKSTLLAMLAHSSESKEKSLLGRPFRSDFSEIIKWSEQYDKAEQDTFRIKCKNSDSIHIVRTYFNKSKTGKRFRVLTETYSVKALIDQNNITSPKKNFKKESSQKALYPVFYLGLSRLYPIGEKNFPRMINPEEITEEENDCYFRWRRDVLGNENAKPTVQRLTWNSQKDVKVSFEAEHHGPLNISAGQDNISQILYAVLSFRRLKSQSNEDNPYLGGLLFIDEFDATLHPAAQKNLLTLLVKLSKELQIQIFFSTHNLGLLSDVKDVSQNDYDIFVFSKSLDNLVDILKNMPFSTIRNQLSEGPISKILVFCEDQESEWLLKKLLEGFKGFEIRALSLGCEIIKKIQKVCLDLMFVFDGDVNMSEIDTKNYVILPSLPVSSSQIQNSKSPEALIYNYLEITLGKKEHKLTRQIFNAGYDPDRILSLNRLIKKEREKMKKWFNTNYQIFEEMNIIAYWKEDYPEQFEDFKKNFENVYNCVYTQAES